MTAVNTIYDAAHPAMLNLLEIVELVEIASIAHNGQHVPVRCSVLPLSRLITPRRVLVLQHYR